MGEILHKVCIIIPYIGEILRRYAKSFLYYMGEILREVCIIIPILYWRRFYVPMQNHSYIISERFCIGYAKLLLYIMGKCYSVGVC